MDIVCILFNGKERHLPSYSANAGYSSEWVDKLARAIKRNTTKSHKLICLTDREYTFNETVTQVALDCQDLGWACVMEAFRPGLGKGRRFVIGLDTLITNNIDELLNWRGECGLLTDPFEPHTICNGIGLFSAAEVKRIWNLWQHRAESNINYQYKNLPSEMAFLRAVCLNATRLDQVFVNQIQSYKVHWTHQPEHRSKARIVYFHGNPKPPNIEPELMTHWL